MDNILLEQSFLKGTYMPCSSKSVAHRAIIIGALSFKDMIIYDVDMSDDILATINALKNLGFNIIVKDKEVIIKKTLIEKKDNKILDANESGSTLRFLIPIYKRICNSFKAVGKGRLPKRPLSEYLKIFDEQDIYYEKEKDFLPLYIKGDFKYNKFKVRGDVSSQYITGLMLQSLLTDNETVIEITGKIESKAYIDITLKMLNDFGHFAKMEDNIITVKRGKTLIDSYVVEKDWSQTAFFLCGGVINGDITIKNMNINSCQGDKKILDILNKMGGDIKVLNNDIIAKKSKLKAIEIDASEIPDLIPVLSVTSMFAKGVTKVYNAKRLRYKESDRISSTCNMLKAFGTKVEEYEDMFLIYENKEIKPCKVETLYDHRIVMSATMGSLRATGDIKVLDYKSINKSYPKFFDDYFSLGGKGKYIN